MDLGLRFAHESYQFFYRQNGQNWTPFGGPQPSYKLSDEYCGGLAFTGTFIALSAHDMSGQMRAADFSRFEYREFPAQTGFLSAPFPAHQTTEQEVVADL